MQAHRFTVLLVTCALVMGMVAPGASFGAIPGSYYSVAVWPDVPGSFAAPGDISVAASGDVYVVDSSNCRIKRMSAAGAVLGVWGSRGTSSGQFGDPQGVTVLPSGRVVVADTGNNRLQLFEADGTYVATWGGPGTGNLQFSAPSGMGSDASGNVYVADSGNGRIQKISSAGVFVASIGSYGPGNGQLDNPRDVAIDAGGSIYVADTNNRRIEKFNSAGSYTTYWGPVEVGGNTYSRYNAPSGISVDSAGNLFVIDSGGMRYTPSDPSSLTYFVERCGPTGAIISQWGSAGTTSGKFVSPRGVFARPGGGVYSADTGNNRVQVLSAAGAVDAIWSGRGTAPGTLDSPQGVAIDASGQAFVADTLNNRIQVFDASGAFVRTFGVSGAGNGQFNAPIDVAMASSGNVLVVDRGNNRIQTFTPAGVWVSSFGTAGAGNGQFSSPEGIGVDASGNIYVADTGNVRMQKFSSAGVWGMTVAGTVSVPLAAPVDVATDASGNIFLLDRTMARVRVYDNAGAFVRTIGSSGSTDGQFFQPTGIAVSGSSVFVFDSGNARIQRLTTAGVFETAFGTFGGGTGELAWPSKGVVDATGRVIVAERDNHRLQVFSYDGTAPVTTLSGFVNFLTYSAPVTMSLAATDSASGVTAIFYTINAGVTTTYTAPVSIATEGLNTIRYWAVDRSGNVEGIKTARVTIDTTPPSGTFEVAGGADFVSTTTVDAVGIFDDAVDMRFTTTGSWPASFDGYAPLQTLTLAGEGTHTVQAQYRDSAGNTASVQDTVTVDLTAPSSVASASAAGWSNMPVTVSLQATDTASGVSRITYRIGSGGLDTTYTAPFVVSDEGVTDVYFRAIDKVGNSETTRSVPVYLDFTAPTGSLVVAGGQSLVSTASVALDSAVPDAVDMRVDPGSGVFGAWGLYQPSIIATVPSEGSLFLRVEYRDRAANTLILGGGLTVDLIAPTTTAPGITGQVFSAPVLVTLEATDTVSGVVETYYRLGAGGNQLYSAPFTVSAEGTTVITFWSVDAVGHAEEPKTATVRIDTVAPIGTFQLAGGASYALTENVSADSVFADAADMSFDAGAGFGPWFPYADTTSVVLSGEGTHTVSAQFRDAVGNTRAMADSVFVDLAAPETTVTLSPAGWSSGPVTVSVAASDTGSGVSSVLYRIGSTVVTYTAPFQISTEGQTTIECWSIDRAGRVSAIVTAVARVDTGAPVGTMRISGGAEYATTRTVSVDSTVTGATEMAIDSGTGYGAWVAYQESVPVTFTTDGYQTIAVMYRDAADNRLTLSASITVDTAAPQFSDAWVTVDSWRRPKLPTGNLTARWTATDAGSATGYSWTVDQSAAGTPDTLADTAGTMLATTVPTHGSWYFHIRARDTAGNWSATRTVRFEVTYGRTRGRVFR